ncbi:MAG: DUF3426 domain-containing protein [Ardenticatenales bacterium]|nr:DUF3426 domain-containing protein [Ardenticatenales bacterium]MCB9171795.1 DUF3426 domain-containing protein [Ardenticatenales bacterium]
MKTRSRLTLLLIIVLLGVGCGRSAPVPRPTPPGVASPTAPRDALPTPDATPTVSASATPDAAQLDSAFTTPRGDLTVRYPSAWRLADRSDNSETLITIQPNEMRHTAFITHLQSSGGPLAADGLAVFADAYIQSLFGEAVESAVRREGQQRILTVRREEAAGTVQYELRFQPHGSVVAVMTLVTLADRWDEEAPLLDGMARAVAVNESAFPATAPQLAAETAPVDGLSVGRYTAFADEEGGWHLVGEVRNRTDRPLTAITVEASLLDGAGNVLATRQQRTALRQIAATATTPFAIDFDPFEGVPSEVALSVSGAEATPSTVSISQRITVTATNNAEPALGRYLLTGTLTNDGELPLSQIRVAAALYDANDRLLAVVSEALETAALERGATLPFTLTVFVMDEGEVARYDLWAEGVETPDE